MARVAARGTRAVLFVAVLLPLWSSYLVKVYAWRRSSPRRVPQLELDEARARARAPRLHEQGRLDRLQLRLAAVHDPAGLRLARADPRLDDRGLRRTSAPGPGGRPSVILPLLAARARRRLDLHLLADARRLHHADCSSAAPARSSSATSSTAVGSRTTCRSRRPWRWSRS